MNSSARLEWTGHPLADVGVATLCAMVGKDDPTTLTPEDLDAAGAEIKSAYTHGILEAFLSCVFTMNHPATNPTMKPATRETSLRRLLAPHRSEPDIGASGMRCAFTGGSATHLLDRSQMPLLTGAGVLNFFPAGLSALPVAAPFLLAIQALPLGGRRSEGKLLIVHCDDPRWTLQFASRYLARNRQLIDLARTNQLPDNEGPHLSLDRECAGWDKQKKRPKYPDAKAPHSLVMADLVEVVAARGTGALAKAYTSVSVYLLSNSGQGPSLLIEHIPGQFVDFLKTLHGSSVESRWKRLVARSWREARGSESESSEGRAPERGKAGRSKKTSTSRVPPGPGRSRNDLYNDLLRVFESGTCDWQLGASFIRRHLLWGGAWRVTKDSAPITREHLELIDWELTTLFLTRVMGMNQNRLELIRNFADRLAELIDEHNDRGLFRGLVFTAGEWQYRALLTRVQRNYAREKESLLFGLQEYLDMFLTDDEQDKVSWSLIRDLISIRLVERLFERNFFTRAGNEDVLGLAEESEPATTD